MILAAFCASTILFAQETVLFNFNGTNGQYPQAGLVFDTAGNLYGTTASGGVYGYGAVFELTPGAAGWTETVLHSFNSNSQDGIGPSSGLVIDQEGNLYGTTYYGGTGKCRSDYPGCGTVFELSRSSGGGWNEKVIYSFRAGADGALPATTLTSHSRGFYGTTVSGGKGACHQGDFVGCGTVFELTPTMQGQWKERVVHSFDGSDGAYLYGPVLLDSAGDIYGTTETGGAVCPDHVTCGFVFKLTTSNGEIVETILHKFVGGTDGEWPVGALAIDQAGNLYGSSLFGGGNNANCYGCGTVFQLSPASGGGWTESVLHSFADGTMDGFNPFAGVIRDNAGTLYGTTAYGGSSGGNGTVFMVDTSGAETVLYSFAGGTSDGAYPDAGVVMGADGNLYGTTQEGGTNNYGTIFEVTP